MGEPQRHFITICRDALEALMDPEEEVALAANATQQHPACVMLVGLQGTGKTTTAAKLAHLLATEKGLRPMLVAADVYRPAAIQQLQVLGEQLGVPVYAEEDGDPPEICQRAVFEAQRCGCDVVIFDTAGRLALDDLLMLELEEIARRTRPDHVLMVVDAMVGRSAVAVAQEFNARLEVDGFVLTKLDGDSRGGAALSITQVTGKPIVCVGMGEGLDDLRPFRARGVADRMLGRGDLDELAARVKRTGMDEDKARRQLEQMLQGRLDYDDFMAQLDQVQSMGPMHEWVRLIPGVAQWMPAGLEQVDVTPWRAMSQSMTRKERSQPDLLNNARSRWRRIARGSGRQERDVRELVRRFAAMRAMMGALGPSGGMDVNTLFEPWGPSEHETMSSDKPGAAMPSMPGHVPPMVLSPTSVGTSGSPQGRSQHRTTARNKRLKNRARRLRKKLK
ncbi:MAG: signal recognition particle protein [Myxococcota bacterium]